MELYEVMDKDCLAFDEPLGSKEEVFDFLIKRLYECEAIQDKAVFKEAVFYRESLSETGLGDGVAIPHGVSSCVNKAAIAYVRLAAPIPWESLDDQPIRHVFLLAIPERGDDVHIRMLSELARSLIRPGVIQAINEAETAEDLLDAIQRKEETV